MKQLKQNSPVTAGTRVFSMFALKSADGSPMLRLHTMYAFRPGSISIEINQAQAADLIQSLELFVQTGELET